MMRLIWSSNVSSSSVVGLVAERNVHGGSGASALAGVGFVDDDCEPSTSVLVRNGVDDERELLDGRDDDFLAFGDELAQVSRGLGVADCRADLGELADGVRDLFVQQAAVGDDDYGVEHGLTVVGQLDELSGEPRD